MQAQAKNVLALLTDKDCGNRDVTTRLEAFLLRLEVQDKKRQAWETWISGEGAEGLISSVVFRVNMVGGPGGQIDRSISSFLSVGVAGWDFMLGSCQRPLVSPERPPKAPCRPRLQSAYHLPLT